MGTALEDLIGLSTKTRQRISVLDKRHPAHEMWRSVFFRAYRTFGTVYATAINIGVSSKEVNKLIQTDPEFAESIREANQDVGEMLVGETIRRAMNGSDLLLMFATKRFDPTFKEQQPVTNVLVDNRKTYIGFSPDQWDQLPDKSSVKLIEGTAEVVSQTVSQPVENVSHETLITLERSE